MDDAHLLSNSLAALINSCCQNRLATIRLIQQLLNIRTVDKLREPLNAIVAMPSSPRPSPSLTDKYPSLTDKALRMSYRIARGEQGVLTFEPYKSFLLPHWRFRTVPIARTSSATLWDKFLEYYDAGDFVGMDMTRKFIQMGMTRAGRYANYKGGRKYVEGMQLEKSKGHEGMREKREASDVFRGVWERCKEHEGYKSLKEGFVKEQKEWDKEVKKKEKKEDTVKEEGSDEGTINLREKFKTES